MLFSLIPQIHIIVPTPLLWPVNPTIPQPSLTLRLMARDPSPCLWGVCPLPLPVPVLPVKPFPNISWWEPCGLLPAAQAEQATLPFRSQPSWPSGVSRHCDFQSCAGSQPLFSPTSGTTEWTILPCIQIMVNSSTEENFLKNLAHTYLRRPLA